MTPERWGRVESLYNQARRKRQEELAEFLTRACAGDDELQREIESLLGYDTGTVTALDSPAVAVAARALAAEKGRTLAVLPGMVLDGKYRIERQLGKGGMGAVFQAVHLGTTRTVAVKVIVPQFAGEEAFLLRFRREAEAAGRLRHPNVVNVTDFGSAVVNDGQIAYLVMEFLDGQNLSTFLKSNPKPPVDEILDIVDQVASALDAAHESGIIHRDLKPDNIWLQRNHRGGFHVKVLDFGIAKLHNPVSAAATGWVAGPSSGVATWGAPLEAAGSGSIDGARLHTKVGSLLGTPAYMAPEQCQGTDVDASADIYSLSVMVYQMYCGCLPFEAKSLEELLKRQVEELPMPPSERDPAISRRLSQAILRGLSKIPAARPPSATALAAQLRAGSEGEKNLLVNGKVVSSNYTESFFPLLLACFAPQVLFGGVLYWLLRTLSARAIVPAGVLVTVFHILLFAGLFFVSQLFKAGSALLLIEAARVGHFDRQWRPAFWKMVRSMRSILTTHLLSTLDVRPQSFLAGHLWPVVWASEGLSGRAALARAADLGKAEPYATAGVASRQWGILSSTSLFLLCMAAVVAKKFGEHLRPAYVELLTSPGAPVVWLVVQYPTVLSLLIFRFFGPASFFLYLSARRCLGETVEFSLPSASREKRSRRAGLVRPATIIWLSLPILMLLFLWFHR